MFTLKNNLYIFILGATLYSLIEIFWRGYSHLSMFILGGLSGLFLCKLSSSNQSIYILALYGTIGITFAEFVVGLTVNKLLKLNVWDYSGIPLNIMGQICPLYSLFWYILSFTVLIFFRKLYI